MTDWLFQIGSLWIWILIALALIIFLIVLILSSVVRSSGSKAAPVSPIPSSKDEPPPPAAGDEAEEAEAPPAVSAASSFRRALRFLRSSVPGSDYRYRVPWYLVIGDPGSGKSAMISAAGADLAPHEHPHSRQPLEWRFLDRGVLIGVAGKYFKGGSSREGYDWGKLLWLLQNNRPRRPLDGVILTIPASDLTGPAALDEGRLSARAARFSELLSEAQRTLGFIFPVYVVVTKCDELPGFAPFCRELPLRSHDEIFGWSSPYQLEASFTPDWVEEAFDSLTQDLQRLQSEIFVERSDMKNPEGVFLFPEEFAGLRAPLGIYLDRLFRETAYREAFRFRGIYFCGDTSEYTTPEQPPALPTSEEERLLSQIAPPAPAPAAFAVRKSPSYVKGLLEEKILPECGVARPLARVALTKSRTVTYIQAAAAVLALILVAGTWLSYRRLAGDRDRLMPALLKMTGTGSAGAVAGQEAVPQRTFGLGLLRNLDDAANVYFWSPFQPASWFSPMDDSVTRVMKVACERWVLSSLQADLVLRKRKLLYPSLVGAAPAEAKEEQPAGEDAAQETPTVASLENTAEYQRLASLVSEMTALAEATAIYENLRQQGQLESTDRIRKLLDYLELREVRPTGHLAKALQQTSGPSARIDQVDIDTAEEMLRGIEGELLKNWFENNEALYHAEQLRQAIGDLQRGRIANYQGLKTLLGQINQVENDFTDPNFRWLSGASMTLPASLQRVTVNPLAGPNNTELAVYTRQLGEGYLSQVRSGLRDQRTALTNLMFEPSVPIGLSAGTKQLQLALDNTLNLPYMSTSLEPRPIQVTIEPGRRLIWRIEPLKEALRLHGIHTQFVRDGLRGSPDALTSTLSRVALDQLTRHVQDLIAQSQVFQPRTSGTSGTTADDETLPEVDSFKQAQDSLIQLADEFNALGQPNIRNSVLRVMVLQSYNLLTILDRRLNDKAPYAIKEGAWPVRNPMSLAVFDVVNPPALAETLGRERDNIKFLVQQAESLTPFLAQYMPVRAEAQTQLIAKWKGLVDDFKQYEGKRPGATLTALEDFITTGIDKIPERSCKEESALDSRPDFFVQVRNRLQVQLTERCRDVVASSVCTSYNVIADQFNQKLSGQFPFAALTPERTQPEASPEDIKAFYKVLDQYGKTARAALDDEARFGAVATRARQFLDQVDALRSLVVPSTPETEKEPPFTLDLIPHFRSNRANEVGGNQIIDWNLQVGGQIFQVKDPEHAGRWRQGNPVRLALRWANDSQYIPVADGQPNLTIRGRNAYFEFTNRWALLSFLQRQQSAPSDLAPSEDPQPYMLKFRLKTALDSKWTSSESAPAEAFSTVFLHMRILPAGGKTPVALPPFPTTAPGLGAVCSQR
jgi:type VI secretion system protein ImpL